MKRALEVVLLSSIVVICVGCKANKAASTPASHATPQSDSSGTIIQSSTGDCSPIVNSTGDQEVNIRGCPQKGQRTVLKTNDGSMIIQTTSGDNSPIVNSTGSGSVNIVITDNDGFKSPNGKTSLICEDGSKPTGDLCADGTAPRELHATNHKN